MTDRAGSGDARLDPAAAPAGPPEPAGALGQSPEEPGPLDGTEAGTAIPDLLNRIAELEDLRLRAVADLDNLRKRCASQVSRAEQETRAAVAREWLPVIDNLERALAYAKSDPGAIVDGVRAVWEQALGVLARLGFPRRDDRGAMFDPARHEAVASRPDPAAADGSVLEVVRPGYGEGDHQLRPAQVVVARSG